MIHTGFVKSNECSADLELNMTLEFLITKAKVIITQQQTSEEKYNGSKRRLTDPRRNKIGIPMPNLPPKMVTADKSWNACGPKSCNISSESSREKQ